MSIVPILSYSNADTMKYEILDPNFVTGFSDAESCFYIKIKKNKSYSTGWVVELNFQIGLHQNDRPLLELIQLFFGVGKVYKLGKDYYQYRVTSHKDLAVEIILINIR